MADLDEDGFPDVVTANRLSRNLSVLLGNGDGSFQAAQRLAMDDSPASVAVSDLNLDGHLDLVTANATFDLGSSIFLGNGDGTFAPPQSFDVNRRPASIAVADLNLDGLPDLVTANAPSGDVTILLK